MRKDGDKGAPNEQAKTRKRRGNAQAKLRWPLQPYADGLK
jgi:hypothetical protein